MQQANSAKPAQRLATKYRFDDEDMDLFFVAALGWGPAGGLDVGQAFHVASQITDGDGESWVRAFAGPRPGPISTNRTGYSGCSGRSLFGSRGGQAKHRPLHSP